MNRKQFVTVTLSLVFALTVASPMARAGSVAGFGGSTEITQIANNIELVNSYIQQVQAYANQLQQYAIMVRNAQNIPNQIWGNAQQDLMGVAKIVQQGNALAYSSQNIGTQFQNTFKGFNYPPGFNYKTSYKDWSQKTLAGIKGAFDAAGMQSDNFATEEQVLVSLRAQSTNATGQMQAIQVGNQVAEQQVQQLQKLRQLMMVQMQAQNSYLAAQEQKEAARTLAQEDFFQYVNPNKGITQFRGGSK